MANSHIGLFSPVKGFASEKSFERYVHDEENYEKVLAAIIFDHEFKNTSDPLPQEVRRLYTVISKLFFHLTGI